MFKPRRVILTALPALLLCAPSIFLKATTQSPPQAKLFAEGVINTDADEYGPTFAPDGKTLYFTRRVNRRDSEFIYASRLENGKWSTPELAPFSGKYFDKEPFVTPDGKRIFFASLRPVDGVEPKNSRDFNIWFVEKTTNGWSEPKHVGIAVNSPAYENYPSVAANGTLYFAGEREGGKGGNDLYRAPLVDGRYGQVERLDELNTPNVDADPYIAPDESYLIFCSGRSGGFGSGDLYISFNRNGKWTEPKNLGAAINTSEFEYTPLISPDGKWLFFSRGWGEIYHIDRKAIDLAVNFGGPNEQSGMTLIEKAEEDKKVVASAIIPGGESLTLHSKILGENRTVFVSLPASYPRGVQSYPVLYLTDAQWNFEHTRATALFLARNRIIPEMIIVGVTNPDRTHDLYATRADFKHNGRTIPFPNSGNADQFLGFFEKELIPWTEGAYRTAPLRILAGHSAGGAFALHAMRVKPALFQAVMAASPWLAWDDHKELKELVPFLASDKALARTLFFTYADEGPEMKADIDALTSALRSRKDTSLRWDSATYPNESHDSMVVKSYYDALRMIFAGWSYPRDPQTNFLRGSLDDVKAHYRRLGERLGFASLPPEAIVNELGYQLLRMNNLDAALAAFRFNTEQYPQSANVWDSLGEALERAGKKEEALTSYRKAVSVAEPKGAPNLESFRKQVARLSEILRSGEK